MASIVDKHNKKITSNNPTGPPQKECNCRKKEECPLDNNCFSTNLIYNARVTTDEETTGKNYIGLTEGTFKQRYTQHKLSLQPTALNSQNISGNSKTTRKTIQSTGQPSPQQAHTTTNPKDATFV